MLSIGAKHATAPGVPRISILYVLTLSEAKIFFRPFGGWASRLGQAARKDEGSNLTTYLLSYSKFPSFSAFLHEFHTPSSLVFEISVLQFQLAYNVVPQFSGK